MGFKPHRHYLFVTFRYLLMQEECLFAHYHFRETDDLIAELIPFLRTVNHFTFLVVSSRKSSDCFVVFGIEIGIFGFDSHHFVLLEEAYEFLINQSNTLAHSLAPSCAGSSRASR